MKLSRIYQEDCTIGILNTGSGLRLLTLELPDLDNQVSISCIPEGTYKYKFIVSPSLGQCIEISDVVGRTYIRIHAGNYTRQIQGCILVGSSIQDIDKDGILDVGNSVASLKKLMEDVDPEGTIEITGASHGNIQ